MDFLYMAKQFNIQEEKQKKHETGQIIKISGCEDRKIFFFVISEKYPLVPSYGQLFEILLKVKVFCVEYDIEKLAIPRIDYETCNLNFEIVTAMIKMIFHDTVIKIQFFLDNTDYNQTFPSKEKL